jgi:hypothetical protein
MPNQTLPVGQAYPMPGAESFTMAVFKSSDIPAGTNLYTLPPMDEDADIYLIARVFAQFREDACIHGNDRVDGAFIKAARWLMGAVEARSEMTDEQIVEAWNAMPDGDKGFMKSWGYLQFARAILASTRAKP